MQLGRFEKKNFVTDCFHKEKINENYPVNLPSGLFEKRNFVTDCFYKEVKRERSC